MEELKDLHIKLTIDILFISQKLALYYNKKYSIELTLKERDKVYLL